MTLPRLNMMIEIHGEVISCSGKHSSGREYPSAASTAPPAPGKRGTKVFEPTMPGAPGAVASASTADFALQSLSGRGAQK